MTTAIDTSIAPDVDTPALDAAELHRYSRHLTLPEVGVEGQRRLKAARVLLVGAGGLGSPLGLYLAAAGVGTLGIVDFDRVDASNLQRQVLYGDGDVGRPKVEAAVERLRGINPHVELRPHPVKLTAGNARELVAEYDVIADGSDNFTARYLVNDACVAAGKPDVWGAIDRFEGQASVFYPPPGPCYRCLFPQPPPAGVVPSCAEAGVLGVLPGIVGAIQANEVVKLILGIGEPLVGRLLIFDALRLRFRELTLKRDPACPRCSAAGVDQPLVEETGAVCAAPGAGEMEEKMWSEDEDVPFEISVEQLKRWLDEGREVTIIDVREPHEYEICSIEGAVLLPLREVPHRTDEIVVERLTVIHCHHGGRSANAVGYLRQQGFERVTNLGGGIEAWSLRIDPSVPRY